MDVKILPMAIVAALVVRKLNIGNRWNYKGEDRNERRFVIMR